jgi:serine/threonine protein kinase
VLASTQTECSAEGTRTVSDGEAVSGLRAKTLPIQPEVGEAFGRYILLSCIGRGGMGVVYEAYDPHLERKVALKVIAIATTVAAHSNGKADDVSLAQQRLIEEAKSQAKLAHPNVVTIYDVGHSPFGIYLAMELVEGQTLRAWLAAAPRSVSSIVELFLQAASGLAAAHDAGLVHRDFKPDNLLLGSDGVLRIADFGLAIGTSQAKASSNRATNASQDPNELVHATVATVIEGTPSYMAPEQYAAHGELTPRSDLFAFFVSLFEAITGEKPFAGNTPQDRLNAIADGIDFQSGLARKIPRWLRPVLARGLSYRAEDRYASMPEVKEALTMGAQPKASRLAFGLASLSVLVLSLVVYTLSRPDPKLEACKARAHAAEDLWSPQTWDEVNTAFARTGLRFAADAFERVNLHVSERVRAWTSTYESTCQARGETGQRSVRTRECLDRQFIVLKEIAARYRKAEASEVQGAARVVAAMDHPEACLRTTRHSDDRDRPSDPKNLGRYLAMRQDIEALTTAHLIDPAYASLSTRDALLERAAHLGNPGILATGFALDARLSSLGLDLRRALTMSDRARAFAQATRDDSVRADVAGQQVFLRGYKAGVDDDADAILRTAQAALARAGNDPLVAAQICASSVPYLTLRGDGDRAESCLRASILALENEYGTNHPETIRAFEYLAVAIAHRRFDPEIGTLLRSAQRAIKTTMGPFHPQLGMNYYNLSSFNTDSGDMVEATKNFENMQELARRSNLGLDLELLGLSHQATAYLKRGLLGKAIEVSSQCIDLAKREAKMATQGPLVLCSLTNAKIRALRGDYLACAINDENPGDYLTMPVSGLFGEYGRAEALELFRDIATLCGDRARAEQAQHLRIEFHKTLLHRTGSGVEQLDTSLYMRGKMSPAAFEEMLRRALGEIRWSEQPNDRVTLLDAREAWIDALLITDQFRLARTILAQDLPVHVQSFGPDPASTWRIELLNARASLALGDAESVVTELETLARAVDIDDQDLASASYLHALIGRARLKRVPNDPEGKRALNLARAKALQLRIVPLGLKALLEQEA